MSRNTLRANGAASLVTASDNHRCTIIRRCIQCIDGRGANAVYRWCGGGIFRTGDGGSNLDQSHGNVLHCQWSADRSAASDQRRRHCTSWMPRRCQSRKLNAVSHLATDLKCTDGVSLESCVAETSHDYPLSEIIVAGDPQPAARRPPTQLIDWLLTHWLNIYCVFFSFVLPLSTFISICKLAFCQAVINEYCIVLYWHYPTLSSHSVY